MNRPQRSGNQHDEADVGPASTRYLATPVPGTEPTADDELPPLLEALLLAAPESATVEQLAEAAGVSLDRVESTLTDLSATNHRGWQIVRHGDRVHLATAPRFAEQVRRFLGLERETRLTGASLETLAIVAYRQPATRAEIEAIRGVDCSGVLSTLLGRGLIEVVGRLEALGNPLQYGTTPVLLQHFGLASLDELPPLGVIDGVEASELLEARTTASDTV